LDSLSKEKRSWNMSRIRSNDTKPELIVRSFLHRNGFRFRLHDKKLPGKPDIVLKKYKTVIEVRGCFWHRHERCTKATSPSTNTEYWQTKFQNNMQRDKRHERELHDLGWNLIVVWECEIRGNTFPPKALLDFVNEQRNISSTFNARKS